MKQSDAAHFLYRDLQTITTHLLLKTYDGVFEEQMQDYFPFNEAIMDWLTELYASERYGAFGEENLSLYFEKEHPFLFIRDLAHINSWNRGYQSKDRRDHITGLMFSGDTSFALEATLCLCRPSLINESQSQWFDFKQAMQNLETTPQDDLLLQAWKACALFTLYFHLSDEGQPVQRQDLLDLIDPYREALEIAEHEGCEPLKKEVAIVLGAARAQSTRTMLDGFQR